MNMFDDIPDWKLQEIYDQMVKERLEQRAKKLGRPVTTWGGKRSNSGRKKLIKTATVIEIELNSIQKKILVEMGDGSLSDGVLKLINENM